MALRVVITAGASGIGLAMAKCFQQAGHRVWIADCNTTALNVLEDIEKTTLDVTDEAAMQLWIAEVNNRWGGIDIACANAGIAGPTNRLEDIHLSDWDRTVAVNLNGAFLLTKYVAPIMKHQRSGALIYTSSTAGQYGYPNRAPYSSAKWALHGLMKTAAMELGEYGVRANAICPGGVNGARFQGVMQREADQKNTDYNTIYQGYVSGTSLRTLIEPEDIAETALFLAQSQRISGQILAVDGHTENPDPKI